MSEKKTTEVVKPQGGASPPAKTGWSFPTAFTILFALIPFVAALIWIIPAGEYERVANEQLGKEVPVPGTYHQVASNPQRLIISMLMAPIDGLYDPVGGTARAIDVALFVLMIGGFLGVVTKTGAIDAGIANGLVNLINPTFAVVMGGLAIGRIGYDRWLKFMWPLLVILMILIVAVLSIGAA